MEKECWLQPAPGSKEEGEMILKYQGVIHKIMKRMHTQEHTDYSYEDYVALGNIALCKAIRTFDPDKGFSFLTYAFRCVTNELLKSVRIRSVSANYSLDYIIYSSDGKDVALQDAIPDDNQFEQHILTTDSVNFLLSKLQKKERDIITMYYGLNEEGQYTEKEISFRTGYSQSYISRVILNAVKNLRDIVDLYHIAKEEIYDGLNCNSISYKRL